MFPILACKGQGFPIYLIAEVAAACWPGRLKHTIIMLLIVVCHASKHASKGLNLVALGGGSMTDMSGGQRPCGHHTIATKDKGDTL